MELTASCIREFILVIKIIITLYGYQNKYKELLNNHLIFNINSLILQYVSF
jgi:hypothetical protein